MSTALYRRYRPETFAEVIGQDHVTAPLMQALRSGRVNHAYLFSGPRGCGKTTSARILARTLNCAQNTPQTPIDTPCGVCPSCVDLARGGPGSLDVVEIDAASHGGVDDARDLRERATFAPTRDRYKIFIIDEAHMVSPAGFNALLKIVEEPPEHIKFVFATTEPDKVIGTIRSRTHHYPFRLVPPDVLGPYLEELCTAEGVGVGSGVFPLVTRAGGGSVRDSLSVMDQLIAGAENGQVDYERAVALLGYTHATLLDDVVDALAARDGASIFRVVDQVIATGHEPRRFVEDVLERLRDLIVIAVSGEEAQAVLRDHPADQLARMRTQAQNLGMSELSRAADLVNAALTEMAGATSPRLHLELLVARLLLPGADDGAAGFAARLDRLERGGLGAAPAGPVPAAPGPVVSGPVATLRPVPDAAASGPAVSSPEPGLTGAAAVRAALRPARGTLPPPAAATSAPAPAGPTPAAAVEQPGPVAQATPVEQPGSVAQATPVEQTDAVEQATPVEQATAPSQPTGEGTATTQAPEGDAERVPAERAPGRGAAHIPAVEESASDAEPTAERTDEPAGAPAAEPTEDRAEGRAEPPAEEPTGASPGAGPVEPAESPSAAQAAAPAGQREETTTAVPSGVASGAPSMTTEELRRRWPEVLETLSSSRATWSLVSMNAQVAELHPDVLFLAFPSPGLARTFSSSRHTAAVQDAVYQTLGLQLRVEARLAEDGHGQGHGGGGGGGGGGSAPVAGPGDPGGAAVPDPGADVEPASWPADDAVPANTSPGDDVAPPAGVSSPARASAAPVLASSPVGSSSAVLDASRGGAVALQERPVHQESSPSPRATVIDAADAAWLAGAPATIAVTAPSDAAGSVDPSSLGAAPSRGAAPSPGTTARTAVADDRPGPSGGAVDAADEAWLAGASLSEPPADLDDGPEPEPVVEQERQRPAPAPAAGETPRQAAERREAERRASVRATTPVRVAPEDDAPSADDPDIVSTGLVGAQLVVRLLDGKIVEEIQDPGA
ncbi:DNA polymerase III subunit gamma and tau [Cellulosimicrobium sp. Marseille-Q4280]|uniref:DNA polymerase III subunit gamma and tau n=1 Tax=Cellulosimicrobium sp. Marseille-Q4280 TaxID=2937992 RepID=UPI00203D0773|nr:DNA polymerase III subunit gamma and tau [Cellulosimicrobium sp. Marseille-Q4280]